MIKGKEERNTMYHKYFEPNQTLKSQNDIYFLHFSFFLLQRNITEISIGGLK